MSPSNGRVQSRTPPYILIILMLIMAILAIKYWSVSNDNLKLQSELDTLSRKSKDLKVGKLDAEGQIDQANRDLDVAKVELEQMRRKMRKDEESLAEAKTAWSQKESDVVICRQALSDCKESLTGKLKDLESLEVANLEAKKHLETLQQEHAIQLKEASAKCEKSIDCTLQVKEVLRVLSTRISLDQIGSALSAAGLNSKILLDGIQRANIGNNTPNAAIMAKNLSTVLQGGVQPQQAGQKLPQDMEQGQDNALNQPAAQGTQKPGQQDQLPADKLKENETNLKAEVIKEEKVPALDNTLGKPTDDRLDKPSDVDAPPQRYNIIPAGREGPTREDGGGGLFEDTDKEDKKMDAIEKEEGKVIEADDGDDEDEKGMGGESLDFIPEEIAKRQK